MDSCSDQVPDDVIRLLSEGRVGVIAFASHTTQVFQVLYLIFFGVLKRRPRDELPFSMKADHDFTQTMGALNV
jgi:hypothetical protein